MSAERVVALAGLVLALGLLAWLGPIAVRSWRIYAGIRTRRLADAGPLAMTPPAPVAQRLGELQALGFGRIGERWLQLPGRPVAYEWVVGEASGETYVAALPAVVSGGAMVACYSSFEDGTWVRTSFPRGTTLRRPSLIATVVSSSVADALAAHRREVDALRAAHGQQRRIHTMADTLRMDDDYRRRHGGVALRGLTFRLVAPGVLAAGMAGLFAVLFLLAR